MNDFPVSYSDQTTPLQDILQDTDSRDAFEKIASKGFEVHLGLTPGYAQQIIGMSREPAIREYCPNDCAKRFVDLSSTEAWLAKRRATFILLKKTDTGLQLAGYGWSGLETNDKVPGGQTTFAIRVGSVGQGQGLATPFAELIINGTKQIYGAQKFWLETWASNAGAVHIYHKLGFEDVAKFMADRPTADGGKVADTRLFMKLPD